MLTSLITLAIILAIIIVPGMAIQYMEERADAQKG